MSDLTPEKLSDLFRVDQTIFHDDPKRPGNCFAACVATALGLPLARDRTSWSWSTYEQALAAVLPGLLADVWDEGHADGLGDAVEYREHRKARNPYRPETTAGDATDAPVTPAAPDAINPPPNPSAAVTGPHSPERTTR